MSSNISRADSGIAEIVVVVIFLVGVVSGLSDSRDTTDTPAGDLLTSQFVASLIIEGVSNFSCSILVTVALLISF